MMYFNNCGNIEELKNTYKALCRNYHPDLSEDANATEIMQQINAEFTEAFERLKRAGATATAENGQQESGADEGTPAEFMVIINELVRCEGLTVDLIGTWVWATGNTYQHKDILKRLNFKYASKKKAWFWHRAEDGCKSRRNLTLNEIKSKYGCKTYATVATPRITATV